MAKDFDVQFINELTGDPAVLLTVTRTGEHILLDCGNLDSGNHRDLLKARNLFVSHTHVDHFIGFDRLIRLNIPHRKQLNVWGPKGIIQQIQYKILGYTWNLIDDDQLPFLVSEVNSQPMQNSGYLVKGNEFQAVIETKPSSNPIVQLKGGVKVSAYACDHNGTDSISYHIQFPPMVRVEKDKLNKLSYKSGPWIQELIDAYLKKDLDGNLEIEGKAYSLKSLADQLIYLEDPSSLLYLTDVSFDSRNLEVLRKIGSVSDLICESSFLAEDLDRAVSKAHLTSRQAALIASLLEVQDFMPFHVSSIYSDDYQRVITEAQGFFEEFKRLGKVELEALIDSELSNIDQCRSDLGLD